MGLLRTVFGGGKPSSEEELLSQLPNQIGPWIRSSNIRKFPGAGCSVAYRVGNGCTTSIYLYGKVSELASSDHDSGEFCRVVPAEFDRAKRELGRFKQSAEQASKSGEDDQLILLSENPRIVAMCAAVSSLNSDGALLGKSYLWLTSLSGHFFKCRATVNASSENSNEPFALAEKYIFELVQTLAVMLRNGRLSE